MHIAIYINASMHIALYINASMHIALYINASMHIALYINASMHIALYINASMHICIAGPHTHTHHGGTTCSGYWFGSGSSEERSDLARHSPYAIPSRW